MSCSAMVLQMRTASKRVGMHGNMDHGDTGNGTDNQGPGDQDLHALDYHSVAKQAFALRTTFVLV